jgi:hypothetical protein
MDATPVAVIVGLVDSRQIGDRRQSHKAILDAFEMVDGRVTRMQPLHATLGDEFQAVYPSIAAAVEVGRTLQRRL